MRQVILDTETTGLKVEEGHRVIEIGCVEMVNRKLTGKHFHYYLNPQREIEAGALAVHGITHDFLQDKPLFASIAQEFMGFISGAEVIIHNAPFDLAFLNNELRLAGSDFESMTDHCSVIDTLQMARKIHAGQRNNLDALCKRYGVDSSKRDLHGALLDASLLAHVYLAMTGGQGNFFDSLNEELSKPVKQNDVTVNAAPLQVNIHVVRATEHEIAQHNDYLLLLQKQGKCVWDNKNILDGIQK